MTILKYYNFARRNLFTIICCTLLSSAAGFLYSNSLNTNLFDNQLFVSISIQDKQKSTNAYENLQAADQITESIQGWLKDPSLQQQLHQQTGLNFPFSGKRQEKNNLLINFVSSDQASASTFNQALVSTLKQRVTEYSQNSDLTILLNPQTLFTSQKSNPQAIYLIIATLLGLTLGLIFSWLYEEINGRSKTKS